MPDSIKQAVTDEVQSMLQDQAIEEVLPLSAPGFFHHPFAVEKPDGRHRPIADLRPLNKLLTYEHFQMESIKTLRSLLRPNDWMARLDLKSAYLHVPIHPEHRPYLDFFHLGKRYRYRCLPFGLSCAPRVFTKLLKPVVAHLRSQGVRLVIYLDDLLIIGDTESHLQQHLKMTMDLLESLGFLLNEKKSELTPCRRIRFLGFEVDSNKMTLRLPKEKLRDIRKAVVQARSHPTMPLRHLASLIGKIGAASLALLPGRLQHRFLLRDKNHALQRGLTYTDLVTLSRPARDELDWWLHHLEEWNGRAIVPAPVQRTLTTDASELGWGAYLDSHNQTNGPWTPAELLLPINVRELMAVQFGLLSFLPLLRNKVVKVQTDNITTMAYINKMGGTRSDNLLLVAKQIWSVCLDHNILLQSVYLPGIDNSVADLLSRRTSDRNDWTLHPHVFRLLQRLWGPMDIDLFASRMSSKLPQFVSWRPDPYAMAVDAFSLDWNRFRLPYINAPFALLDRVLAKIRQEQATVVIIAPLWPSRPFYPMLLQMICDIPRLLPPWPNLMRPPPGSRRHTYLPPVGTTHQFVAWKLSGNTSRILAFHQRLSNSCPSRPSHLPLELTTQLGTNGCAGVVNGVSIPLIPLLPTSSTFWRMF